MVETYSWLTLVPPLLTILLAIFTRRVMISIALGIVSGALLIADFHFLGFFQHLAGAFIGQFTDGEGGFDPYNLLILIFLFQLGIITSLVMMSGGAKTFSAWMAEKIRSRRGAQGLALGSAVVLFVDDYLSALAVGQIARPVTDKFKVSRAKLAYVVDSTAAPMTVLVPFSSWGASIIGLLAPVVAASTLGLNDITVFLGAAISNYYAIAALVLVCAVVVLQLDIGSMRTEERRAMETGMPYNPEEAIPGAVDGDLPIAQSSGKRSLIVPFVVLTVAIIGMLYFTGWRESGSANLITALGDALLPQSLVTGGTIAILCAIYYYLKYTRDEPETFPPSMLWKSILSGLKSMLVANSILVLAWALGNLIGDLGTGEYLAELIERFDIGLHWLPAVLFLIAGFMAFSTGTSWGSFGLLIPLTGTIVLGVGADEMLMACLGAVLAGAVLGDHISPISDTTILSSTGSQANIITHVRTQLPYAFLAALAAVVGYIVAAFTDGPWWGLLATFVTLVAELVIAHNMTKKVEDKVRAMSAPQGTR